MNKWEKYRKNESNKVYYEKPYYNNKVPNTDFKMKNNSDKPLFLLFLVEKIMFFCLLIKTTGNIF